MSRAEGARRREQILAMAKNRPLNARGVADLFGISQSNAQQVLRKMTERGALVKTEQGYTAAAA